MTGDEDREDDDEDREDDDEDDPFFESDVTSISAWDLLGEGFEHEMASIGMFLAHDSSVLFRCKVFGGIGSQSTSYLYTQGR